MESRCIVDAITEETNGMPTSREGSDDSLLLDRVDLEQVTSIARQMVGRWGMSHAVGPVSVLPEPEFDFGFMTCDGLAPSESTRQLVDTEIRSIVDDCHRRATEILRTNRALLDRLANELLARETLDEADAYAVVGLPVPPVVAR